MAKIRLTKKLIYAAATDAAERSRRRRGLTAWDDEATDAYMAQFDRLFEAIGGAHGWIDLPRE
jgi:hypothetical protein